MTDIITSDPFPARPSGQIPDNAQTSDQSTASAAKEQAGEVSQHAADAGQQVAGVAKEQAQALTAEAGAQAKDLLNQTRTELTNQASIQQQRLAAGLHSLGDELHAMTQHESDSGVATDLAHQAAAKSHDLASWLEAREPGSLVGELKDFARRRPGAFLGLAAGAGVLAGRLTRGVKDASSDSEPSTPASSAASAGHLHGHESLPEVSPTIVPRAPVSATAEAVLEPDRGLGLGAGI